MRKDCIRIGLVVLSFYVHTHPCWAQQGMIRTYTMQDGLVMNRVRGFYQDTDGFIWIYTWDGLSRYEGNRFRNYITGN